MRIYIRTEVSSDILKDLFKYYYNIFIPLGYNNKVDNYLKENYKLNLKEILFYLKNIVTIDDVEEDKKCILFIRNTKYKNINMDDIVEFLEYGNLEIKAPKIISKILFAVRDKMKEMLGGI